MQVTERRIVVLGTGGTIAGRGASAADNVGYRAGQVPVADLLRGLAGPGLRIESEQVAQIDSKDMDFGTWCALAQRCAHWLAQEDVQGVVVTHGTDTMEETSLRYWRRPSRWS
jgi:L-asparaginase